MSMPRLSLAERFIAINDLFNAAVVNEDPSPSCAALGHVIGQAAELLQLSDLGAVATLTPKQRLFLHSIINLCAGRIRSLVYPFLVAELPPVPPPSASIINPQKQEDDDVRLAWERFDRGR